MSYTAKSVIFDNTNNHGNSTNMGVRAIEFYLDGVLEALTSSDYTAYSTNYDGVYYTPTRAFNTTLSKTGTAYQQSFAYADNHVALRRLIVVFNTPVEFDSIKVINYHHSGGSVDKGFKDTKIYISDLEITNVVYNTDVDNYTKIFDGTISAHVESDVEGAETLELIALPYPENIDSGNPVLDNVYGWSKMVPEYITTGIPVLGAPLAKTMAISFGVPDVGSPEGYPISAIVDLVSGTPVLESPGELFYGAANTIISAIPEVDSPVGRVIGFTEDILSSAPVFGSPEGTNNIFIHLNVTTPETTCEIHAGGSIYLETTETTVFFTADTENIAGIDATIGRTTVAIEASTDLVASMGFDLPASSMVAYSGETINIETPEASMTATALNDSLVSMALTVPRTQGSFIGVNQPNVTFAFSTPRVQVETTGINAAIATIDATLGVLSCDMFAFTEALVEMDVIVPETSAAIESHSDNLVYLVFSSPEVNWESVINTHSNSVLRHVRGTVR